MITPYSILGKRKDPRLNLGEIPGLRDSLIFKETTDE
jgi:hypothetical protein